MKQLYCGLVSCCRSTEYRATSAVFMADNLEEARGIMLREAEKDLPPNSCWMNFDVKAFAVDASLIRSAAALLSAEQE